MKALTIIMLMCALSLILGICIEIIIDENKKINDCKEVIKNTCPEEKFIEPVNISLELNKT